MVEKLSSGNGDRGGDQIGRVSMDECKLQRAEEVFLHVQIRWEIGIVEETLKEGCVVDKEQLKKLGDEELCQPR